MLETDITNEPADKPKLVCVVRQKFPNPDNPNVTRKLRTGKYVAQGGHAYQLALAEAQRQNTPAYQDWIATRIAKVCLYVETEAELLELWEKIQASGLPCALIKDSGLTEFGGESTYTAIGIGPAYGFELKPLTGHLPLF